LAVFFGAFGSHVLKVRLGEKLFSVYQTANQYHFWHTLALLFVAYLQTSKQQRFLLASLWSYLVGLILFSGGLYLYAVTGGMREFAMIAPLGGAAFMLGWLFLLLGVLRISAEARN